MRDRLAAVARAPAGLIAFVLLALLAASARLQPLRDFDTFFHLTAAEELLTSGTFITPDTRSFTATGKTYVNVPWLADLLLHGIHARAGYAGLQLFVALAALASVLLIGRVAVRAARGRMSTALVATALTAGVTSIRLEARPEAIALVFMPLAMLLADAFADAPSSARGRLFGLGAALVALQLLWSNCHHSFILLPAVVALALLPTERALAVERLKRGLVLFVPLAIALALHPGGVSGYLETLETVTLGDATAHITEMRPPELAYFLPTTINTYLWLDLLILMAAVRALWHRRLRPADLLGALLGLLLVSVANRFRVFWALLLLPFAAREHDAPEAEDPPLRRTASLLAALGVVPLTVLGATTRLPERGFGFGIDRDVFPVDAAALLVRTGAHGRLLHQYEDGSFLGHEVAPAVQIAIDGRTPTLFDEEVYFFTRRATKDLAAFTSFEATYRPDLALLYRATAPCSDLLASGRWRAIYLDDRRTLFARSDALADLPAITHVSPCAPEASIRRACEDLAASRAELDRLVRLVPEAPYPRLLSAQLELACGGDASRAIAFTDEALASGTRSWSLHAVRARALAVHGERAEARDEADLAVGLGGGVEAHILRARLALDAQDVAAALEDFRWVAKELDDQLPVALRLEYARALGAVGSKTLAVLQARRAARTGGGAEATALLRELGAEP